MENAQLFGQIREAKENNPKIAKALDVFRHTQDIYERSMRAISPYQKFAQRGTYSSSISKKDYHANISTTT
ncbi:MAG: hypothetical protein ABIJ23_00265 [Candidatus Magasanikbacteria bacterium]